MTARRAMVIAMTYVLLPAMVGLAEDADAPAVDPELDRAVEAVEQTCRKLRRENMQPPSAPTGPSPLAETIAEVRRMRLDAEDARRRREQASGATSQPSGSSTTRPSTRPVVRPLPRPQVSPEALAKIKASPPRDPTQAARLADNLFTEGYLDVAYVLYECALEHEASDEQTAWLVFQMANCKRESDAEAARRLYGQLIAEYPDSRWVGPAKVQKKILGWRLDHRPRAAIAQARESIESDVD